MKKFSPTYFCDRTERTIWYEIVKWDSFSAVERGTDKPATDSGHGAQFLLKGPMQVTESLHFLTSNVDERSTVLLQIILWLSFNNTKICLNKWELGFDGDHKIYLKWVAFISKENCYPRHYLYTLWACPLLQVWYYSTSEHVFICAFIKELSCGIAMTCWRICFGIRGLLARTPLLVLQRTCSASMMTFWKNCQNKPDVRHASWKKMDTMILSKIQPQENIFFCLGHHRYPSLWHSDFYVKVKNSLYYKSKGALRTEGITEYNLHSTAVEIR